MLNSPTLLAILTALTSLAAAWLECFNKETKRPTLAGWVIIVLVVVLAIVSTRDRADLVEQNEGLETQVSAVEELEAQEEDSLLVEVEAIRTQINTLLEELEAQDRQDVPARSLAEMNTPARGNRPGGTRGQAGTSIRVFGGGQIL